MKTILSIAAPVGLLPLSFSATSGVCADATARVFATPREAVNALEQAVNGTNRAAFTALFGSDSLELANPDSVQGALEQAEFADAFNLTNRLLRAAEDRLILEVGDSAWPFPIPLVRGAAGWQFDAQAGREEVQAQEGKLRELSAEVGRTLAAGEKMSASLNTTLVTFDALMKRFGVGEPSTAPRDTNSPPFNILDYAQTAGQVTAMAQQLDLVIKDLGSTLDSPALDRRIAEVAALSKSACNDAQSVLNHAFLLAAGLVALIFGGVWLVRRPASRISTTTRS